MASPEPGEVTGLLGVLRDGGYGIAALAIAAAGVVWRWATAEVRDARAELKETNGRAWALLEKARSKANGNGGDS